VPEPLPEVVHLELAPDPATARSLELVRDAGPPIQPEEPPTAAAPEPVTRASAAVPQPHSIEPRRAARRSPRIERVDASAAGGVRPRVALDRDDFGGL
jgi:hypothetical protein